MVAPSILQERPCVIAGGAERAVGDIDGCKDSVRRPSRVLDTELPCAITLVAGRVHIATELNQKIAKSPIVQDGAGSIHCITFPDTADIHDHALAPEKGHAISFVHLQVAVIDERTPANNLVMFGDPAVLVLLIKSPKARHDAECHIEFPACPVTDLPRSLENIAKFSTHSNGMFAGGGV